MEYCRDRRAVPFLSKEGCDAAVRGPHAFFFGKSKGTDVKDPFPYKTAREKKELSDNFKTAYEKAIYLQPISQHSMTDFAEFVLSHENDDTDRLLLNRDKCCGSIDITLAVNTILCRRRLRDKVPSFYAEPSLIYPSRLSAEQCSSEESAKYKTELVMRLIFPETSDDADKNMVHIFCNKACKNTDIPVRPDRHIRIADLTGGLGVDSAAFAKIAYKVLYNEMNKELAEAARHNFRILGLDNITVSNKMLVPSGQNAYGPDADESVTAEDLLSEFRPDVIFLDPARRADDGKKVFLLEDCRPDILSLKDELLKISGTVIVKLSPMADIDMAVKRLGRHCKFIETVSVKGECKELLAVLDRESEGECTIVANCGGNRFSFTRSEEAECDAASIGNGFETPESIIGRFLLEPDKALMKAAPYKLLCRRFGLVQLDRSTHYFIAGDLPYGTDDAFKGFFKTFRILKAAPLDKRSIKDFAKEFPQAEVTARNIPMTSDLLRKRLGVSASDKYHIFGLKASGRNWLIAATRS